MYKRQEEFIRGNVSELIEQTDAPKGEYVILIEKNPISSKEKEKKQKKEMTVEALYEQYEKQGFEKKEIIKKIAKDKDVSKNEIYQQFISK